MSKVRTRALFNATVFINGTAVNSENPTEISPNDTMIFHFSYHLPENSTPGDTPVAWANTSTVHYDGNVSNNFFSGLEERVLVEIEMLGDVNSDDIVNIQDVVQAARAYQATPDDSGWDLNADVNFDGKINIADLVLIANNWWKLYTE